MPRTKTRVPVKGAKTTAKVTDEEQDQPKAPPRQPMQEATVARSTRGKQAEEERNEANRRHRAEVVAAATVEDEEVIVRRRPQPQRQPAPQKRFLLLSGHHVDNDGEVYKYNRDRPTVITTSDDLDKMFMNKFRRIGGETSAGLDFVDTFDRPALTDPPLAETHPFGIASPFTKDTDKEARERLQATHATDLGEDEEDEEPSEDKPEEDDDF